MVKIFAFRVDAGLTIGSGHVMRCLTLADALTRKGAICNFVTRPHKGNLDDMITARGHKVHSLTLPDSASYGEHHTPPPHADWLGGDWQLDAAETRRALHKIGPDWLILDAYALDQNWQTLALPSGVTLAVIDDLADRPHLAQILLDQNLGRMASDYKDLVPEACELLIGPKHALLRPEFAAFRKTALERRKAASVRHILVTLGGVDKDNATGAVLDALATAQLPEGAHITVVMGASAPWLSDIQIQAASMPYPIKVLTNVTNMAELMTAADLCIGAAGGTAWERCVLGLPTLLMVLAENQIAGAAALNAAGACNVLPLPNQTSFATALHERIAKLCDKAIYIHMAEKCAQLSDGRSSFTNHLLPSDISLRPAVEQDAVAVWSWRHDGDAWKFFRAAQPTPLDDHIAWFKKALSRNNLRLLIAVENGCEIGYIRFDQDSSEPHQNQKLLSICLAGMSRGKGLGARLIHAAVEEARVSGYGRILAEIHCNNKGSLNAFRANGFFEIGQGDSFFQMAYDVPVHTEATHNGVVH